MASPNRISVDVLRKVINGALDFVETDLGLDEIELKQNYYWSIADDVLYTMDSPPKELDVGSLEDDWGFVLSACKNADRQIPVDFIHVAPLLRALAQVVPSHVSPGGSAKE